MKSNPNKISVYRWEHKKSKIGPYRHAPSGKVSKILCAVANSRCLPTPGLDNSWRWTDAHPASRCGFKSLNSMNYWFSETDQELMLQNNFRLVEYKVDITNVTMLNYQILAVLPKRIYRVLKENHARSKLVHTKS